MTNALKYHYDQILNTHFFFYILVHNRSFVDVLANVIPIANFRIYGFWTFICKNLQPSLISLFQVLVWLEKMTSFSEEITHGLKLK